MRGSPCWTRWPSLTKTSATIPDSVEATLASRRLATVPVAVIPDTQSARRAGVTVTETGATCDGATGGAGGGDPARARRATMLPATKTTARLMAMMRVRMLFSLTVIPSPGSVEFVRHSDRTVLPPMTIPLARVQTGPREVQAGFPPQRSSVLPRAETIRAPAQRPWLPPPTGQRPALAPTRRGGRPARLAA